MKQAHLGPADCLKKGLSGAKGLTKARKNNTKNLYTVILYGVSKRDDLTVWVMEKVKTTTKGKRSYRCWMASWREGGKTRNVRQKIESSCRCSLQLEYLNKHLLLIFVALQL